MNPARIITLGDSAQRLLVASQHAQPGVRCLAVFQRSLYLEILSTSVGGVVCVTTAALPMGPLTVRVSSSDFHRLQTAPGLEGEQSLGMPVNHWLDFLGASVWPSQLRCDALWLMPDTTWLRALLLHSPRESLIQYCDHPAISAAGGCAAHSVSVQGLLAAERDYFQAAFRDTKQSLMQLLTVGELLQNPPEEVVAPLLKLVGAGGGMTPAGDDALAGIFIALNLFGKGYVVERLCETLLPDIFSRTHSISSALLKEAAAGRADESMHQLIENISLARLTSVPQSATLLSGMGQTSGWDCLSGMLLVFSAAS